MPNPVADAAKIKSDFAVRRKRQIIATVPFLAAALLLVFAVDPRTETLFGMSSVVWAPVFAALGAVAVVVAFRNWRCPACDKYLGRTMNPNFCPKCGVGLR